MVLIVFFHDSSIFASAVTSCYTLKFMCQCAIVSDRVNTKGKEKEEEEAKKPTEIKHIGWDWVGWDLNPLTKSPESGTLMA